MILTTTETLRASSWKCWGWSRGAPSSPKTSAGTLRRASNAGRGELKAYNEMMNEARALATKRMVAEAEALSADAVVCVRYASGRGDAGAAEVMAYGTALRFI